MFLTRNAGASRAALREAGVIGGVLPSSRLSWNFEGCRTGLKVRLWAGVVAAVEGSRRLSSESTVDGGGSMVLDCV
jgi:hypothetical protein